jgi:hypothetical protein
MLSKLARGPGTTSAIRAARFESSLQNAGHSPTERQLFGQARPMLSYMRIKSSVYTRIHLSHFRTFFVRTRCYDTRQEMWRQRQCVQAIRGRTASATDATVRGNIANPWLYYSGICRVLVARADVEYECLAQPVAIRSAASLPKSWSKQIMITQLQLARTI